MVDTRIHTGGLRAAPGVRLQRSKQSWVLGQAQWKLILMHISASRPASKARCRLDQGSAAPVIDAKL